ncbi:MAG: SDR family oxidoreductase [Bacteroidota bacterium]
MSNNSLQGKTILVTGASKGIGKSLVGVLSRYDCRIIATATKMDSFSNYEIASDKIVFEAFDLNKESEIIEGIDRLKSKNLIPDIIINNAGVGIFKNFADFSSDEIDKLININFKAPVLISKSFLPEMLEKQFGMFVNIISVAAVESFHRSSLYGATKAALLETMKTIRKEYRHQGIKVLNILPGATRTPIWSPKVVQQFGDRMMAPEALAQVIVTNIALAIEQDIMPEEFIIRPHYGDLG